MAGRELTMPYAGILGKKPSFSILVKTGKRATEILDYDAGRDLFVVAVKAQPIEGKANAEIERYFSRLLKRRVTIRSGHAGKRKLLEVR